MRRAERGSPFGGRDLGRGYDFGRTILGEKSELVAGQTRSAARGAFGLGGG